MFTIQILELKEKFLNFLILNAFVVKYTQTSVKPKKARTFEKENVERKVF